MMEEATTASFSQLRSILDSATPQEDVKRSQTTMVPAFDVVEHRQNNSSSFGQSKEFPSALLSSKNKSKTNRRSVRMDELVQDLNSALDESTTPNLSSGAQRPKRKLWRRRCKSTSNLAIIANVTSVGRGQNVAGTSGMVVGRSQNNSIDETSTSSEGEMIEEDPNQNPVARGGEGTSSLQLSDSDDNNTLSSNNMMQGRQDHGGQLVSRRLTPQYSSSVRKKRASLMLSKNSKDEDAMAVDLQDIKLGDQIIQDTPERRAAAMESDSLNENVSSLRPNTKRKRKFKRMALDPESNKVQPKDQRVKLSYELNIKPNLSDTIPSTTKRKKAKVNPAQSGTLLHYLTPSSHPTISVSGKRKRSNREKSVETDAIVFQGPSREIVDEKEEMELDDEASRAPRHRNVAQSSSSLSSSDWDEDNESQGGGNPQNSGREDEDREADDEQSDWPGQVEDGGETFFGISEDEVENDGMNGISMDDKNIQSLTSTARQAYFARMKRLAECVPGREIRAGSRRLRSRQRGFTIKSSSSEQVARFLQDSRRTELRLTVIRPSDRNKIAHLANLYSLSLSYESPPSPYGIGVGVANTSCTNSNSSTSHMLVLTKTGRTLKVSDELQHVHTSYPAADAKRRRRECSFPEKRDPDPGDEEEESDGPPEPPAIISDHEDVKSNSTSEEEEEEVG